MGSPCAENSTFNLPDSTGRVLQGNGNGYLEAGLPNITGNLYEVLHGEGSPASDGVFRTTFSSGYTVNRGSGNTYNVITFDASRSNKIYGASSTVQPKALKLQVCIKY